MKLLSRRGVIAGAALSALADRARGWGLFLMSSGGVAPLSTWQALPVVGGGDCYALDMAANGNFLIATDTQGIYLGSTTVGTSCSQLATNTSMPAAYLTSPTPYFNSDTYAYAIDPSNNANMWAWLGIWGGGHLATVWSSTNSGATWSACAAFPLTLDYGNSWHAQRAMAVDPANSSVVYAGSSATGNLYWTTDGFVTVLNTASGIPVTAGSTGNLPSVCGINFDTTSGTNGSNQTIRAVCAVNYGASPGVYVKNTSNVWSLISGSPTSVTAIEMGSDGTAYCVTKSGLLYRISTANVVTQFTTATSIQTFCINPNNPAQGIAWSYGAECFCPTAAINTGTPSFFGNGTANTGIYALDAPWLAQTGNPSVGGGIKWDPLTITSSSSVTIGTGSLSWTSVSVTGGTIAVGDPIRMSVTGTLTSYVLGTVTSYSPGGPLVLAVGNLDNTTHDYLSSGSTSSQIIFSAKATGASGVTVAINAPSGAGSVSVVSSAITITPAAAAHSVNAVVAQVKASTAASALVKCFNGRYGGTGACPTFTTTSLANNATTDTPYLGAATGGSGSHSTWIGGKERWWIAIGIGVVYIDAPVSGFDGALEFVDQSFGTETLSGTACCWGAGSGPQLYCSDFPLHPVNYNPIGLTTGGQTFQPPSGWGGNIVDGISCAPVTQVSGAYISSYGFSTDGGQTWTAFGGTPVPSFPQYAATTLSLIVAIPGSNTGTAQYSGDGGTTWTNSTGGPTGFTPGHGPFSAFVTQVAADYVNSSNFYCIGQASGTTFVYRSTDAGHTWTQGASLPKGGTVIAAVPGNQSHIFVSTGTQPSSPLTIAAVFSSHPQSGAFLYFSSNGGSSITALPNVLEPLNVAIGAAKPGGSGYPSVGFSGWVSGVYSDAWRIDNFNPANISATTYIDTTAAANNGGTNTNGKVNGSMDAPYSVAMSPDVWDLWVIAFANSGWAIRGFAGLAWPP